MAHQNIHMFQPTIEWHVTLCLYSRFLSSYTGIYEVLCYQLSLHCNIVIYRFSSILCWLLHSINFQYIIRLFFQHLSFLCLILDSSPTIHQPNMDLELRSNIELDTSIILPHSKPPLPTFFSSTYNIFPTIKRVCTACSLVTSIRWRRPTTLKPKLIPQVSLPLNNHKLLANPCPLYKDPPNPIFKSWANAYMTLAFFYIYKPMSHF